MNEKVDLKTRSAIIDASMSLFARRGYHGTSISHIAQMTGLTKGALYWYFKGKEDLFLTVLDTIRENWQQTVMARVEGASGSIGKLEQLFDATSEMAAQDDHPYSMHLFLISAGAQLEMKEFEDAIRAAYTCYVGVIIDIIKTGQEEGEIRRDIDAEFAAVGLIGCLEGIILQARLHPSATVAAAIAEMKRQFLRSLYIPSNPPPKKEKIARRSIDQLNLF